MGFDQKFPLQASKQRASRKAAVERLSHGPVWAGWSQESNPQAKGWLLGIPVWEQQTMMFPITSSPRKKRGPSAMGRPSHQESESAFRVSGDTRDSLQASKDNWERGRLIRETRRVEKSGCPEQDQLSEKGSWEETLKNIHAALGEHQLIHAAALDLFPSWR